MSTNWSHSTPQVSPAQYNSAMVPVRVEGANPADPTQDTFQQASLGAIISAASNPAQASAIAAQGAAAGASASATAASASATASANSAAQAFAALGIQNNLGSTPAALPYEVTAIAGGIGTGTGGTAGTYAGGVSGGPSGFMWTYTIDSTGKLASYTILNPGLSTSNSAPTLSLPSGGLTGATVPTATVGMIPVGRIFSAPTADGLSLGAWGNNAGALATAPFGGTQSKLPLATAISAMVNLTMGNPDALAEMLDANGKVLAKIGLDSTLYAKLGISQTLGNGLSTSQQADGSYVLGFGTVPNQIPVGAGAVDGGQFYNPDVVFYSLTADGRVLQSIDRAGNITTPGSTAPTVPYGVTFGGTGTTTGVLSQMQKLGSAAEKGNLVINPITSAATITSPASAASTTGFTDILPAFNGFAANFTGTTAAGNNVITSVSSTAGLVVGMPLVEANTGSLIGSNIPPGAVITAVGTTTVTMNMPATGAGTGITIHAASDLFDIIGGVAAGYNSNFTISGSTVGNSVNPPTAPCWNLTGGAIEFYTDAANFSTSAPTIMLTCAGGALPAGFRIAIDDAYQSANPVAYGASGMILIQFAAAGIHKVRIETNDGGLFIQHLYLITGASMWKATQANDMRVAFFGDSFFQGGASGSWEPRNIAATLALLMGWRGDHVSVGGTGYTNNGSTNYAWTSTYRIADLTRRPYKAVVFFGSVNDSGSASSVGSAALATWKAARAALPNTPFLIFGVPPTINYSVASAQALEANLQSAFQGWGDGLSWFFPIANDPDGPWIYAGNQATYITAADGTHPLDGVGTLFFAKRMERQIKGLLNSIVTF